MHFAQRPVCSPCAETTCHRSRSGTPHLCWDMSSCLHVFHLAENDVADTVEELGSPGSGQLRKAALSFRGGYRQACWAAPRSPVPDRACQMCLGGAGPTKVKGKQLHSGQQSTGSLCRTAPPPFTARDQTDRNRSALAPSTCNWPCLRRAHAVNCASYMCFIPSPVF